jgi:hypothetical protein
MTFGVPFCERPGQSAVVGVLSGLAGGAVGLAAGLGPAGVAGLAGGLALVGELLGHAVADGPDPDEGSAGAAD